MRISYRTLAALIGMMTEEQKDSDVTVEDAGQKECFAAELRICGENHDSLDHGHPVIYIPMGEIEAREDDVLKIAADIGIADIT